MSELRKPGSGRIDELARQAAANIEDIKIDTAEFKDREEVSGVLFTDVSGNSGFAVSIDELPNDDLIVHFHFPDADQFAGHGTPMDLLNRFAHFDSSYNAAAELEDSLLDTAFNPGEQWPAQTLSVPLRVDGIAGNFEVETASLQPSIFKANKVVDRSDADTESSWEIPGLRDLYDIAHNLAISRVAAGAHDIMIDDELLVYSRRNANLVPKNVFNFVIDELIIAGAVGAGKYLSEHGVPGVFSGYCKAPDLHVSEVDYAHLRYLIGEISAETLSRTMAESQGPLNLRSTGYQMENIRAFFEPTAQAFALRSLYSNSINRRQLLSTSNGEAPIYDVSSIEAFVNSTRSSAKAYRKGTGNNRKQKHQTKHEIERITERVKGTSALETNDPSEIAEFKGSKLKEAYRRVHRGQLDISIFEVALLQRVELGVSIPSQIFADVLFADILVARRNNDQSNQLINAAVSYYELNKAEAPGLIQALERVGLIEGVQRTEDSGVYTITFTVDGETYRSSAGSKGQAAQEAIMELIYDELADINYKFDLEINPGWELPEINKAPNPVEIAHNIADQDGRQFKYERTVILEEEGYYEVKIWLIVDGIEHEEIGSGESIKKATLDSSIQILDGLGIDWQGDGQAVEPSSVLN